MKFEVGDRVRVLHTSIFQCLGLPSRLGTVTSEEIDTWVIVSIDGHPGRYLFSNTSLEKVEKVYPVGEEWPRKVQSTDGMVYNPITGKWSWF